MNVPVDPADFVGIQRLVNRYSDAVVHRNGEQWSSCWADDAVWDLGGGRLVEGKEAIVKLWFAAMGGMAAVVQHTHNGDATYEGSGRDVAVGRWAISERFLTADGHRGLLLAHYDDAYRKADGAWLFTRRFLQVHYRGAPDLSGDFLNTRESLESWGLGPQV
ncbi:MAG: nuclear transport factor 2 family protein [Actinomycetota bacterium]